MYQNMGKCYQSYNCVKIIMTQFTILSNLNKCVLCIFPAANVCLHTYCV